MGSCEWLECPVCDEDGLEDESMVNPICDNRKCEIYAITDDLEIWLAFRKHLKETDPELEKTIDLEECKDEKGDEPCLCYECRSNAY
jgi:hypothetical protein